MNHFQLSPADFAATTITVTAIDAIGKQILAEKFGVGCVSVELRKSGFQAFADYAEGEAFQIEWGRLAITKTVW